MRSPSPHGNGRRWQNGIRGRNCPARLLPLLAIAVRLLLSGSLPADAQSPAPPRDAKPVSSPDPAPQVLILSTNGLVEVLRAGAQTWDFASTFPEKNRLHPGDQLRTGPDSQARVQLADRTIVPIGPNGHLQVLAPSKPGTALRLLRGLFFFLHRDEPGDVEVLTPTVSAVIRGTEFNLAVAADGATELHLLDGAVTLTNALGGLELRSGDAARIEPGQAPARAPRLDGVQPIQWCLYYPAVLDPGDLEWTEAERQRLAASLAAYQTGDLRAALAHHPADPPPDSAAARTYLAALRLAVGDVAGAEARLGPAPANRTEANRHTPAAALRRLIAAVTGRDDGPALVEGSATAWLAESYYQQSRGNLAAARSAARNAAGMAPEFGPARARLGELEFGFGRLQDARREIDHALRLSPRHAHAWALRGFLLAADDQVADALAAFNHAITLDAALGHAWLGRGLLHLRRGARADGRRDLEVAAAAEPQRALPRSYLGKAFADAGDLGRARHELDLARDLDPADPTPWLYSALLNQTGNRINDGIRDLERSRELNDQRSVYRSRFLLDQDQAVRGANLAALFQDAGLHDVAYRTAVRAVEDDYANFSGHLFLANSHARQRDPGQVDLRYETPWLSEFLVANLLAPLRAGVLSQTVSDHEYARLFERDRLGLVAETEYRSDGEWRIGGAQFGSWNRSAYAVEGYYHQDDGDRPNNDLERRTLSLQLKHALTPRDSLFLQAITLESEAGDRARYYDPANANPGLRLTESQEPLLLAGYHHEWAPGQHTLALGARLHDQFNVHNPTQPTLLRYQTNGQLSYVDVFPQDLHYDSQTVIYSGELQQIVSLDPVQLILGARGQAGEIQTRNQMPGFFFVPPTSDTVSSDLRRLTAYSYLHWHPLDALRLIGGLAGDQLTTPENFRSPPVSDGERTIEQLSPKAGLIWQPATHTTVRAAFTRSLSGTSIDQSFQLEPSQVAGFLQSYRSLLPESAAGPVAGASLDTWGLSLEHRFPTETYVGASAEWLQSSARRQRGTFDANETEIAPGVFQVDTTTGTMTEDLDFMERSLTLTLDQLIGQDWALGARYRVSQASLDVRHPGLEQSIPTYGGFEPAQDVDSTLHEIRLYARMNHPSGFFAGADAIWRTQTIAGENPPQPGDAFWQFNLHAGWRGWQRRVEARLSLLNLTDTDYRLNPLNFAADLPRERTLALSLALAF